jgi:hypothetical protein
VATRDELYAKFGMTAESAQLFEVELGSLLLCARAIEQGWSVESDTGNARKLLEDIDRSTLGHLLRNLEKCVTLDADLTDRFTSALNVRNRLVHHFYPLHNFKIQTGEGRDVMMADLEAMHVELFNAWQVASSMAAAATAFLVELRSKRA